VFILKTKLAGLATHCQDLRRDQKVLGIWHKDAQKGTNDCEHPTTRRLE